jgi:type I restriction enzyme M protein
LHHPEFQAFKVATLARYEAWREAHADRLHGLALGDDPKALIFDLSEDLLARFAGAALMDKYAVYQLIMDYWAETMQDDVYLITQDGWLAGGALRELKTNKRRTEPGDARPGAEPAQIQGRFDPASAAGGPLLCRGAGGD